MYASQWIELYFDQAMKTKTENNIRAEATIAELVSNNKKLLEKQITPETIRKFIELCKLQQKHERFIILLTALCSCVDEAIMSNQNDIIEILLEDQLNRDSLIMPIRGVPSETPQTVQIELDPGVWVDFKDFQQASKEQDQGRLYKYYVALVDLAAELCLQRNYRAFQALQEIFPFEYIYDDRCYSLLMDPELSSKIKSKFVKLLLNLHIDRDPLGALNVPNFTRVWNELQLNQEVFIQSSKIEIPVHIMKVKAFVQDYLVRTGGVQSIFDQDKNRMTLEVLKLVKFMVGYGFYKSQEELKEIALPLVALLNGTTDIYEAQSEQLALQEEEEPVEGLKRGTGDRHTAERYKITEDNLLIMKCKQFVCEILIKMSDIENDMKMTQFFLFFKQETHANGEDPPDNEDYPGSFKGTKKGGYAKLGSDEELKKPSEGAGPP